MYWRRSMTSPGRVSLQMLARWLSSSKFGGRIKGSIKNGVLMRAALYYVQIVIWVRCGSISLMPIL